MAHAHPAQAEHVAIPPGIGIEKGNGRPIFVHNLNRRLPGIDPGDKIAHETYPVRPTLGFRQSRIVGMVPSELGLPDQMSSRSLPSRRL